MPRGYRYVILAAFGWLSLAAAPAPNSAAQSEQRKTSKHIPRSFADIARERADARKAVEAAEYQKPCQNTERNYKSDLCAQWYAATAAGDAAKWAFWSVIVAILGTIGLGVTLWFNYRLLRFTQDSGKDAETALAIAERNATAAIQAATMSAKNYEAFLAFEGATIVFKDRGEGSAEAGEDPVIVKLTLMNIGKSPAYIKSFSYQHVVGFDYPDFVPDREIKIEQIAGRDSFDIEIEMHRVRAITPASIVGKVYYTDALLSPKETDFAFKFTIGPKDGAPITGAFRYTYDPITFYATEGRQIEQRG